MLVDLEKIQIEAILANTSGLGYLLIEKLEIALEAFETEVYVFEENNEWEGETWYRAFPISPKNTEFVEKFNKLVSEYENEHGEEDEEITYSIYILPLTEVLDKSQRDGCTSYMHEWGYDDNLSLDANELTKLDDLYKGGKWF